VDLTEFLSEFQSEAVEKLDLIASQLLRLERDATNPQPVREMFLAAHTIKGGAAMMRLTEVEALAHALEDLLSSLRDQERVLDGPTADLLFQALDRLRGMIASASAESVGVEPDAALLQYAERLRSGSPVEPEGPLAPQQARQALVVDDSATVRELHVMLLEDAGYQVEACTDGESALALMAERSFALVVSGIQLSGVNGFELIAAARHTHGHETVPVVLTSADADAQLERRAIECGARALVRKGSLRAENLTAALRQLAA
jgi:chemotaxis protein histidine kinase CheA